MKVMAQDTRGDSRHRLRLLLTLLLAVVLPAAALIGFTVWNLRMIQRNRALEAAIQSDFAYTLKIAEKRIVSQANKLVGDARLGFPTDRDPIAQQLDATLEKFPYVRQAFLYDKQSGWNFRARPQDYSGGKLCPDIEERSKMFYAWLKPELREMTEMLHRKEKVDGVPYYFGARMIPKGDKAEYYSYVIFTLPHFSEERQAVGGFVFDTRYVFDSFLPRVLDDVMRADIADASSNYHPRVAMMVHLKKEKEAIAATSGWDGGQAEVERYLEMAFPGLVLAIKFEGTTVEAIGERFLRTNLAIVIGLSILLAAGILLTYRNVAREMQLARLKSDFVANVSHELRTPLALIRLYAETLELGRLNSQDKFQEYYRIIRKESERLSALINNILDFARIEAGRKEYEFRETDLAELVRSTLDSYRFQIEQQGFTLRENIAVDLPPLKVDREAIARSLLNLVNNALKYSSEEKFLGVNLYRLNGNVRLEVVDHGIGIPRGEQSRIFENFYRVGDPLVHNTKGSGLGLALVRHIVQAHGGNVSVESAPGKGSTFTISLPCSAASGRESGSRAGRVEAPASA